MKIERIQVGYWYPLTTLHLAEIQDFFTAQSTPLHLNGQKLVALRSKLGILSSEMKLGELEYIDMHATSNIAVKVFEDGLVTITDDHTVLSRDVEEIRDYISQAFMPAIHYLFSVGAPSPKKLAQIEHEFPVFIIAKDCTAKHAEAMLKELGESLEFELDTKDMSMFRGGEFFIVSVKPHFTGIEELMETWIYFKEFKSQLHHYLNLHRSIWTQIEAIKEERFIRGWEVKAQRAKLESYKKTIELIEARIAQMDLYMPSRNHVATDRGWDEYLSDILQFKYTNLEHSHDYVKSLWDMTKHYVDSGIQMLTEISAQSTKTSVQTLTVISSIGVIASVITYLSLTKLPKVSGVGIKYFLILVAVAFLVNTVIGFVYSRAKYKVAGAKLAKDLHKYAHKRE